VDGTHRPPPPRFLRPRCFRRTATIGFAGTANAEPNANACFGQIHKTINTEGALGFTNVGDVVKEFGGQGKNGIARGLCE
jgi:hypothetical protein